MGELSHQRGGGETPEADRTCRPGNEGKAALGTAHLIQKRALIAKQYSALHHRTWVTPTVPKPCGLRTKRKSNEESYDSSLDFGVLEGTRIPGPLIKSQMLYRLSYERIFCGKTIPPNNITTIGCKKQERHLKKRKFQFYTTKLLKKTLRPALQQLHQQAGIDADHRGRLAQLHGLALGQVG